MTWSVKLWSPCPTHEEDGTPGEDDHCPAWCDHDTDAIGIISSAGIEVFAIAFVDDPHGERDTLAKELIDPINYELQEKDKRIAALEALIREGRESHTFMDHCTYDCGICTWRHKTYELVPDETPAAEEEKP